MFSIVCIDALSDAKTFSSTFMQPIRSYFEVKLLPETLEQEPDETIVITLFLCMYVSILF